MNLGQVAGSRRKQILRALNDNGPLSVDTLAQVLRPPMSLRSIQAATKRLRDKGLIVPHFESVHYGTNFYRIPHDPKIRERISRWLKIPADLLTQPKYFSRELLHTTQATLWAVRMRDLFPDGEVVRDLQILRSRTYSEMIGFKGEVAELVPDVLLNFKNKAGIGRTTIAVEIEKSRKSAFRLNKKLRKLTAKSRLDGVIYVCENGGVSDAIKAVLEKQELLRSRRIGHYASAFLMFCDCSEIYKTSLLEMFNIEGKRVCLSKWVDTLRKISANFRRDSHFYAP